MFSGFNGLMVFNEDLVFAKLVGHIKEVLYKENKNKPDSIETGHIVTAHCFP